MYVRYYYGDIIGYCFLNVLSGVMFVWFVSFIKVGIEKEKFFYSILIKKKEVRFFKK